MPNFVYFEKPLIAWHGKDLHLEFLVSHLCKLSEEVWRVAEP